MTQQLTLEEAIVERNAVLHLLAVDPRATKTQQAVCAAIDKVTAPGGFVSANDIRPHLPSWVKREQIGPTFGVLVRRGVLARVDWVPSTDPGTHGKPVARYLVNTHAAGAAA